MDATRNARNIPQAEMPPSLPSYLDEQGAPRNKGSWGWFGWEGYCVDAAISQDDAEALRWCHERGFIDRATTTIMGTNLRRLCESHPHLDPGPSRMRAPKCAALLADLGYPA